MACLVSHTTIGCHDAYTPSEWWKQLLGYEDLPGDPEGNEFCVLRSEAELAAHP